MDPDDLRDCIQKAIIELIEPVAWKRCEVVNRAELAAPCGDYRRGRCCVRSSKGLRHSGSLGASLCSAQISRVARRHRLRGEHDRRRPQARAERARERYLRDAGVRGSGAAAASSGCRRDSGTRAVGPGNIVDVLRAAGHEVIGSDLVDYGDPTHFYRRDFLMERKAPDGCEGIVMNAPFKLAAEFVAHALDLCPLVIAVGALAFMESERRTATPRRPGLARIHVFRNRLPMMHRHGWAGTEGQLGDGVRLVLPGIAAIRGRRRSIESRGSDHDPPQPTRSRNCNARWSSTCSGALVVIRGGRTSPTAAGDRQPKPRSSSRLASGRAVPTC